MTNKEVARWLSAAPHVYAWDSEAYQRNSDKAEFLVSQGYLKRHILPEKEIRFTLTREGEAFLESFSSRDEGNADSLFLMATVSGLTKVLERIAVALETIAKRGKA